MAGKLREKGTYAEYMQNVILCKQMGGFFRGGKLPLPNF